MVIPYYRQQKDYTCGPAVLRMALAARGHKLTERTIARCAQTNAKHGTSNFGMQRCLRKLEAPYWMAYRCRYRDLQRSVKEGVVIVDWMPQVIFPDHKEFTPSRNFNPEKDSHYAIVVAAGEHFVTLQDPVLGRRVRVSRVSFMKTWHDAHSSVHWLLCVIRQ